MITVNGKEISEILNSLKAVEISKEKLRIKHPSKGVNPCNGNTAYGRKHTQHEKRLANKASQKTSVNIRLACGCYGKYSNNTMEYKTMCMFHSHTTVKDVARIVDYTGYKNIVGTLDYRNSDEDSKPYCKKVGYEISKQGMQGSSINLAMTGKVEKQVFAAKKAAKKTGKIFLIKK